MMFRCLLQCRQHDVRRLSLIRTTGTVIVANNNFMMVALINNNNRNSFRWMNTTTGKLLNDITTVVRDLDVRIVEVGPRDGIQNESSTTMMIPVSNKVKFIQLLINAGCNSIEVGSFVNPKAVPNMANTSEVLHELQKIIMPTSTSTDTTTTTNNTSTKTKRVGVQFSALVPTIKYLQEALPHHETGILHEIAIFASASETFSQKNLNCSIAESMIRFQDIMNIALPIQLPVRGYLSCTIACPYDGTISSQRVAQYTEQLLSLGCYEVALSDTIGVGTPQSTKTMIDDAIIAAGGQTNVLAVHFHDTYGQALSNILVALDRGITTIDSAVGGLGGCPYAKGATGNVATEDVVYMLNGMNINTGIDIDKLVDASEYICGILNRPITSKVASAIAAKRQKNNETK